MAKLVSDGQCVTKGSFYVAIKLWGRAGIQMSEDVQYGFLLLGEQQAFAFAGAVVGALAEAGYQVGDGDSPLVVGRLFSMFMKPLA